MINKLFFKSLMGLLFFASSAAFAAPDLIVGSTSGSTGSQVTVPVTFTNDSSVVGFGFNIDYDPTVLTVNSVSNPYGGTPFFSSNVGTAGTIAVLGADFALAALPDATINVVFDIVPGAALGGSNIALSGVSFSDAASALVTPDTVTNGVVTVTGPQVTISATDAAADEAGDTGTFTVSRTGDTTNALTVNLTVAGTATSGSDYVAIPGTVTIPAGASDVVITVTPIDDFSDEGAETVVIDLATGTTYDIGTSSTGTVTIADDDAVEVGITSVGTADEAGPVTGTFTVTRTGDTTNSLTVNLTVSGSATNGTDFATIPNTVVIPAGATTVTITLTPIDDAVAEGTEIARITIDAGPAYGILSGEGFAEVSIKDDEVSANATSIPTLSQWGLILLSLSLLGTAVRFGRAKQ